MKSDKERYEYAQTDYELRRGMHNDISLSMIVLLKALALSKIPFPDRHVIMTAAARVQWFRKNKHFTIDWDWDDEYKWSSTDTVWADARLEECIRRLKDFLK